jgi:molecular chaperone DnaK
MGIGVGLPGGRMAPVLARNTKLPATKSYELATTREGQSELELQVFQGDSAKVSECEYLGTVRVPNIPPRPRGAVKVAIEFALGAEGILKITARDLETGEVTEARFATVDTPEALREKLQMSEPQTAPKGARPLEPVSAVRSPERKGLFGRIFGARR